MPRSGVPGGSVCEDRTSIHAAASFSGFPRDIVRDVKSEFRELQAKRLGCRTRDFSGRLFLCGKRLKPNHTCSCISQCILRNAFWRKE